MKYYVRVNGREHEVALELAGAEVTVRVDGEPFELELHEVDAHGQFLAFRQGRSHAAAVDGDESRMGITLAGHFYAVEIEDERERAARAAAHHAGAVGGVVKSVMPGIVVDVLVEQGQEVEQGAPLLILEAMKMQNEIEAPSSGVVDRIHVEAGKTVSSGDKLVTIRAVDE